MADSIPFPTNPAVGDAFKWADRSWVWDGVGWRDASSDLSPVQKVYVKTAGDSMSGFLLLHSDPVEDMHPATMQWVKNQVDTALASAGLDVGLADSLYVRLDGSSSMLAPLPLNSLPSSAEHAANKQYVDNAIATLAALNGLSTDGPSSTSVSYASMADPVPNGVLLTLQWTANGAIQTATYVTAGNKTRDQAAAELVVSAELSPSVASSSNASGGLITLNPNSGYVLGGALLTVGSAPGSSEDMVLSGATFSDPVTVGNIITVSWLENAVAASVVYVVPATADLDTVMAEVADSVEASPGIATATWDGTTLRMVPETGYTLTTGTMTETSVSHITTIEIPTGALTNPSPLDTVVTVSWTENSTPKTVSHTSTADQAISDIMALLITDIEASSGIDSAVWVYPTLTLTSVADVVLSAGSATEVVPDIPEVITTIDPSFAALTTPVTDGTTIELSWIEDGVTKYAAYTATADVPITTAISYIATIVAMSPGVNTAVADADSLLITSVDQVTLTGGSFTEDIPSTEPVITVLNVDIGDLSDPLIDGGEIALQFDIDGVPQEVTYTATGDTSLDVVMEALGTDAEALTGVASAVWGINTLVITSDDDVLLENGVFEYTPPVAGPVYTTIAISIEVLTDPILNGTTVDFSWFEDGVEETATYTTTSDEALSDVMDDIVTQVLTSTNVSAANYDSVSLNITSIDGVALTGGTLIVTDPGVPLNPPVFSAATAGPVDVTVGDTVAPINLAALNTGGAATSWALINEPAGVTITAAGVFNVSTTAAIDLTTVTVVASNADGSDTINIDVTVESVAAGSAPKAVGPFGSLITTQGSGPNRFSMADKFSGDPVTSWTLSPQDGYVKITADGEFTIYTASLLTARLQTVTATNAYGSDSATFNISVEADVGQPVTPSKWKPVLLLSDVAKADPVNNIYPHAGHMRQYFHGGEQCPHDPSKVALVMDVHHLALIPDATADNPHLYFPSGAGVTCRNGVSVTWDRVTPGRLVVAVTSPNISAANGVFVTEDFGETYHQVLEVNMPGGSSGSYKAAYRLWRQMFAWDGNDTLYLLVSPNVTNEGAKNTGAIWKSTNRGESWTRISQAPDTQSWGICHTLKVAANGNLYAAGRNGVRRSTDGGETWTKMALTGIPLGDISSIDLDPSNSSRGYVVVNNVGVYSTIDGFASIQGGHRVTGNYCMVFCHPENWLNVWAVGSNLPSTTKSRFSDDGLVTSTEIQIDADANGWDKDRLGYLPPYAPGLQKSGYYEMQAGVIPLAGTGNDQDSIMHFRCKFFKSNGNGAQGEWACLDADTIGSGQGNLGSIAFSRLTPNRFAIGAFDEGWFETVDGGESWSVAYKGDGGTGAGNNGGQTGGYSTDPANPRKILATAGNYGWSAPVHRKATGGFVQVPLFLADKNPDDGNEPGKHHQQFQYAAYSPCLTGGGNGAGNKLACDHYTSVNDGADWRDVRDAAGWFGDSYAHRIWGQSWTDANIIYGSNGEGSLIKRSLDYGLSWNSGGSVATGVKNLSAGAQGIQVDPVEPSTIYWWQGGVGLVKYNFNTDTKTFFFESIKGKARMDRIAIDPTNPDVKYVWNRNDGGAQIWRQIGTGAVEDITFNLTRGQSNRSIQVCPHTGFLFKVGTTGTQYLLPPTLNAAAVTRKALFEDLYGDPASIISGGGGGGGNAPVINNVGVINGSNNANTLVHSGLVVTPSDATIRYQWYRNGAAAGGPQVSKEFLPWLAGAGEVIHVEIQATANGQTVTANSPSVTLARYEPAVTFDPATNTTDVTYSNGNKTVQGSSTSKFVRCSKYIFSEPTYLEFAVGAGATGLAAFGITFEQAPASPGLGASTPDIAIYTANGKSFGPSGDATGLPTMTVAAGDVIGLAFDVLKGKMWWRIQSKGGAWLPSGSPENGTGGVLTPTREPLVPAICPRMNSGTGFTLRSQRAEFTMPIGSTSKLKSYAEAESIIESNDFVETGDSFIDRYGINAHLNWRLKDGADTVYAKKLYLPLLKDLKPRRLRTGIGNSAGAIADALDLAVNYGMKLMVHVAENQAGQNQTPNPVFSASLITGLMDSLVTNGLAPYVEGVEGPNEANHYATSGWADRSRAALQVIIDKRDATPALSHVVVPTVSTWKRSLVADDMLGDQSAADFGNGHFYAGAATVQSVTSVMHHATDDSAANIENYVSMRKLFADKLARVGNKGIMVTEYGVHHGNDKFTVPEVIGGEYSLRQFIHFIALGAEACWHYNIIDDATTQDEFGMYAQNFATQTVGAKRPIFDQVKAFIAYFDNPNQGSQPTIKPRFHISGDVSKVIWHPVQMDTNKYAVLMFNDRPRWDGTNIITVPNITAKFGSWKAIKSARLIQFFPTFKTTAIPVPTAGGDLTISIGAAPQAIEVTV